MKINKKDVLIINQVKEDDYSLKELRKNGYASFVTFKSVPFILRIIRKIWIRLGFPFECIWYGDWKKEICHYKYVIFHVSSLTINLCKYINKKNKNASVVAWYWNPIGDSSTCLPNQIKGDCSIWSFDPNDCNTYGINFNHQYYCQSYVCGQIKQEYNWDIYFVGANKGRLSILKRIWNKCVHDDIICKFQVIDHKEEIPIEFKSEYVDYFEVRKNIICSKAILELLQGCQSGPSLRTMEAIYFDKKLITNNKNIVNEPFYCKENVLVIDELDDADIKNFLMTKMEPYSEELKKEYDVEKWVERFFES